MRRELHDPVGVDLGGVVIHLRTIVRPLRKVRVVFCALVSNLILVPLLAAAIDRVIPLDPPLALALFLLAGSAGAPFLVKLAKTARSDLALSASLLLVLVPVTVVFLPFYVPLAMRHPTLRGLTYVPASTVALAVPLLSTMILPVIVGLTVKALAGRGAAWLALVVGNLATVALVITVIATFGANLREVIRIMTTGALPAALLLNLGAFALFPIAWLVSRREPRVGPPILPPRASHSQGTPEPA